MAEFEALAAAGITSVGTEEATSVMATMIGQVISFVRMVGNTFLNWITRLVQWGGENPLAASMLFMNLLIWFS